MNPGYAGKHESGNAPRAFDIIAFTYQHVWYDKPKES